MPRHSHCPLPLLTPRLTRFRPFDIYFDTVLPHPSTVPQPILSLNLHNAVVAQLMSFLPQSRSFLWVDWFALAPAHIRCRPPVSNAHPLSYPWSPFSNQFILCDSVLFAELLLDHLSVFPTFLTVLTMSSFPQMHAILSHASFFVVSFQDDTPLASPDCDSFYASGFNKVYFICGWPSVPRTFPSMITIHVHPLWDSYVPVRFSKLVVPAWLANLQLHPNDALVLGTMDDITFGACYGFVGNRLKPVLNPVHPQFYACDLAPAIAKDVSKGFRTKPFPLALPPPLPNCHRYPIKGVDKTFDVKVRLVNAQGAPYDGTDVNSNIEIVNSKLFTFKVAMALLLICGRNTLMFKYDAEAAFKVLDLHVQDFHLNGEALPDATAFSVKPNFGVKSSGKLWDALGGLAEFIFRAVASLLLSLHFLLRYSDDFLQMVPVCDNHLLSTLSVFCAVFLKANELGLSIGKFTYPSTEIIWLGLILNSVTMTASITEERRLYLLYHITLWQRRGYAARAEIESIHGHLQFAASVIKHGRFFLGDITALIYAQPERNFVEISKAAKADLAWWYRLLVTYSWSGIHYLVRDAWATDTSLLLEITTDACKKGRGIYFAGKWCSLAWTPVQLARASRSKALSMVFLELHAIVDACATFGREWRGKQITIQTDSQACVDSWKLQRSHNAELRFLFREICLLMSVHSFDLNLIHIAGKLNVKADLLSRLQVEKFLRLDPAADCFETTISEWWLRD